MGLWILQNAYTSRVITDLLKITNGDSGLAVSSSTGSVTYIRTAAGNGPALVEKMVRSACNIGIRGENSSWSFDPAAGNTMVDAGGIAVYDQYPGTNVIEIVYDINNCNGNGSWIEDASHTHWAEPTDVILYHELAHAMHMCDGTFIPANPEPQAIIEENKYRAVLNLPIRVGHAGGCGVAPLRPQPPQPPRPPNGCFIASAAYGSPLEPEVEFLRRFRDDILRKTRAGEQFFDNFYEYYYHMSPIVVEMMEQDEQLKNAVRSFLVDPIVQYLQIALRFPDAPLKSIEEPWRSFLIDLRNNLERWAKAIVLPHDFDGLPALAAAEEIAIAMRYMLRTDHSRVAYLARLQEQGQIPLHAEEEVKQEIITRLQSTGRTRAQIAQILGLEDPPPSAGDGQLKIVQARGTDHARQRDARFPANEWIYTVTFSNNSTDTFDQVVLFYKRVGLPGVVFLEAPAFRPGTKIIFVLGICSQVESYAMGVYFFDAQGNLSEVARIPSQGNMTPALASQLNPTDTDLCADSWSIS